MIDHQSTATATAVSRKQKIGYGTAPLLTIGVLTIGLAALVIGGGINAATAMAAATDRETAKELQASPPRPDAEAPVGEPTTPPDRDSDHSEGVAEEDVVYMIKRGDTLTAISAQLGVSVDAIAEYNAIRDVDVISEGAALRLPFIYVPPAESDGQD